MPEGAETEGGSGSATGDERGTTAAAEHHRRKRHPPRRSQRRAAQREQLVVEAWQALTTITLRLFFKRRCWAALGQHLKGYASLGH